MEEVTRDPLPDEVILLNVILLNTDEDYCLKTTLLDMETFRILYFEKVFNIHDNGYDRVAIISGHYRDLENLIPTVAYFNTVTCGSLCANNSFPPKQVYQNHLDTTIEEYKSGSKNITYLDGVRRNIINSLLNKRRHFMNQIRELESKTRKIKRRYSKLGHINQLYIQYTDEVNHINTLIDEMSATLQ